MSLSTEISKGAGAAVAFAADTVLDTNAPEINALANQMRGQSYGYEHKLGFTPTTPHR